ncbi:MAG: N-acetylneuraminate synthase [Spirochaetaceae bacterium]|nr:MAG: N-acetylneuraminate synthase [Spirochaetaceae bacterium]
MSTARSFIIAEAGVNHNGSLETARQLVRAAHGAGADAVKFQTFRADAIVSRAAPKADYQRRTTAAEESQHAMLSRLELDLDAHQRLMALCDELGIVFLSSPFDQDSADLLETLGITRYKLGSGEITNLPLLSHVAAKARPIILSTGMATLGEVEQAVHAITAAGNTQLTLLHCVTEYPAPVSEVNLNAMITLRHAFGFAVGYSDHTEGTEIAVAAAALGASVIEKHLTLNRADSGPDHSASLEPAEFAAMVAAVRNTEAALGDGVKQPAPCEQKNIAAARKSIVARVNIATGEVLTAERLAVKRPGTGLPPALLDAVMGRSARRDITADELITWDCLL